jgi:hypothetical protein
MLTKDDLFTSVSKTAVNLQQDSVPKEKRAYTKGTKKRMPSQAERYKIGKLLEENLTPKDEHGLVSYLNGMTDDKIAELIGPAVSRDTVRNMRQEVFGITRKVFPRRSHNSSEGELAARIEKLEEMFTKLAEEIGSTYKHTYYRE